MAWNHKGFEIEATATGRFITKYGDVTVSKDSLSAVKKYIDKQLEIKAKEVALSLPVVILQASNRFSSENKRKIVSAVITGMDNSLAVLGIPQESGWKNDEILPASKENEKLLNDYVRVEAELLKIKDLVDRRSVGTHFGNPYSVRNKIQYHEAVKRLQENYEKAKKSQSE